MIALLNCTGTIILVKALLMRFHQILFKPLISGSCKHIGTVWTEWSECSAPCEGGITFRTRAVVNGVGSSCMKRDEFVEEACNRDACPPPPCKLIGTDWTEWSPCSASCGTGTSHRTREAVVGAFFNCTKVDEIEATVCRVAGVGWLSGTTAESLRAFGERVFANFRDKNIVFYNCGKTGHLWLSKDLHTHRHVPPNTLFDV